MSSDVKHSGDSARVQGDLKVNKSNHVFDGAGENIQCHSDSESLGSRRSRTRYINSAIYIEPAESAHSATSLRTNSSSSDVTPHPHSSYHSNSTPMLTGRESSVSSGSVKRKSCRLLASRPDGEDDTPRLDCTYREDGNDTFRLSVASLSTTTSVKLERDRKKEEAFREWLARKERERREKARLEKLKRQAQPTTTPEQREESYRRWLERKRAQAQQQRAEEILQRYRKDEQLEQRRTKKEHEKEEKLNEWIKKKEEEMKMMKTREERKAARAAIEEQRRRATSERAYRDWLRTSKNKPLPVPLNQGVLSMRGSVSQMYINPIPWKSLT